MLGDFNDDNNNHNDKILVSELAIPDEEDMDDENWNLNAKEHTINSNLTHLQKSMILDILKEHDVVFARSLNELGQCTIGEQDIVTTTEQPIFTPVYRESQAANDVINIEVEKLLEAKLIIPSTSPWSSSVLPIPKKDKSLRFVVDYRPIN